MIAGARSAVMLAAAFLGLCAVAAAQPSPGQIAKMTKIRMTIDGAAVIATLEDSAAARDFVSMLPLTLTLRDYASTEKVSDLPRKLSTQGAPPGSDPSIGDISYYAPWGNLALFYKDFGYSAGLVKLGTIDSGVEVLQRPGPLAARIEVLRNE